MIKTYKIGEQFPDVSHRSDLLPVGTRISTSPGRHGETYDQVAPRVWTNRQASGMIDGYYLSTPLYLMDLAGRDEIVLPPESAASFRWRLRDTALGAGERSSVKIPPIAAMCAEFGASVPYFQVGGIVTSRHDMAALPQGSVVYAGHPDKPSYLNVWEVDDGGSLTHVMGPSNYLGDGRPVTIYSIPGVKESEPEDPASDEALAKIALRAYRIGKTYQHKQNWCSVFNNCLAGLGINDTMLASVGATMHGPGDVLRKEQIAAMPEGTILWHQWRSGYATFAVYVRDDSARGKAKTRRLFGHDDDGSNTHDLMTVVQTPEEPMAWSVSGTYAQHFPNGTVLRAGAGQAFTMDDATRCNITAYYSYAVMAVPL